ncbi:hypothetical protein DFQ30_001771, partial [Apophysomyces sp. BC1015]
QELQKSADCILGHYKVNKHLQSLNRDRPPSQRSNMQQQRDTWYTPPEQAISRTPMNLTSLTPPGSLNTKLLTIACAESISDLKQPTDSQAEDALDTDEFGWKYDGQQWYNCITGTTTTSNPYHESDR